VADGGGAVARAGDGGHAQRGADPHGDAPDPCGPSREATVAPDARGRDIAGSDAELVGAMYNQLVVAIGQIPGVTVAPGSAMEVYKTQPKPAAEMAQELHVGALLEGNVFRAGQRMRITLQLTNPRTIEQIWSNSFDIDLSGDLFDAIDGVIPQIAEGIHQAVAAPTTRP
jgi:TolB-like protein